MVTPPPSPSKKGKRPASLLYKVLFPGTNSANKERILNSGSHYESPSGTATIFTQQRKESQERRGDQKLAMICSKAVYSISQPGKSVSFAIGIKVLPFSYFEFLFQPLISLNQLCYFVTLRGRNLFKCSKRVGQTHLESQLRKQLKCPVPEN